MEGINAWIESQDDSRYHVPTEYCGDIDEVSVKLEKPKDKEEFDEEEIEVRINAGSEVGIDKLELWVNGERRETIESSYYEGKIKLSAGQYELHARAFSREDEEAKSNTVRIGTGGEPWEKPEPTPIPEQDDESDQEEEEADEPEQTPEPDNAESDGGQEEAQESEEDSEGSEETSD